MNREDDLKTFLRDRLCRRFCTYYKPEKREDIACAGYAMIERLAKSGTAISFDLADEAPRGEDEKRLRGIICARCPFHEADCDYVMATSGQGSVHAETEPPPCGGFVLLLRLLGSGKVGIEVVEKIACTNR